jgi:hypothetical protein
VKKHLPSSPQKVNEAELRRDLTLCSSGLERSPQIRRISVAEFEGGWEATATYTGDLAVDLLQIQQRVLGEHGQIACRGSGEPVGLFASTVHVVDIGGLGMGPDGRQVFEEGCRYR